MTLSIPRTDAQVVSYICKLAKRHPVDAFKRTLKTDMWAMTRRHAYSNSQASTFFGMCLDTIKGLTVESAFAVKCLNTIIRVNKNLLKQLPKVGEELPKRIRRFVNKFPDLPKTVSGLREFLNREIDGARSFRFDIVVPHPD